MIVDTATWVTQYEAEMDCEECPCVFWTDASEHMGSIEIEDAACPECGSSNTTILGLE